MVLAIWRIILATDAAELLKPALHRAEKEGHIYCAIDGLIRYQYVTELESPNADKFGLNL